MKITKGFLDENRNNNKQPLAMCKRVLVDRTTAAQFHTLGRYVLEERMRKYDWYNYVALIHIPIYLTHIHMHIYKSN